MEERLFKEQKNNHRLKALLTLSLPLGCANNGNQQEALSAQTPGGVSHRT